MLTISRDADIATSVKGFFINCQQPERGVPMMAETALHEYMADVFTCIHLPDFLTYEDGAMIAWFWNCLPGPRANVSGSDRACDGLGPVGQAV